MGTMTTASVKVTTALAAGVLILGAAGCSNADEDSATPTTTASSVNETGANVQMPPHGNMSGSLGVVELDGRAVDAVFEPIRCAWDTDDGRQQLDFDAGRDPAGGELVVELVTADPPRLDDFGLETGGTEWEATDQQRRDATITVDGDNYRITSQVTEDDGMRTAELRAEFSCARR